MRKPEILFHIAREHGLEFVFTSGDALRYPVHTHVSVHTVTLVRRGAVRLLRGSGECLYGPGAVYGVAPHEPHGPAYSDAFDLVSLCVDAALLRTTTPATLEEVYSLLARSFVARSLLAPEDAAALFAGVREAFLAHAPGVVPPAPSGSRFQYIRRFHERMGVTPHQYLIQNRLREAKRLLAEGVPLADAALMAGFADQSHCNRLFNRRIGITPGAYRESCFLLSP